MTILCVHVAYKLADNMARGNTGQDFAECPEDVLIS